MKRWFFLVLLSASMAACSLSPVKSTPTHQYALLKVSQQRLSRHATRRSILVNAPLASPGYRTDRMLYLKTPYRLSAFSHNTWIAPPSSMLLPLLVESLRNTHYYHAVMPAPFGGMTDLRLETHLEQLHQNFLQAPSRVEVILAASLVNNKTNRVVASRRFKSSVPARSDNPYGGVIAANQAVAEVLQKISAFSVRHS